MPEQEGCIVVNTESTKLNIIVTLVTDVILLLIMLVGLLRIRRYGCGKFGLGYLMWKQVGFSVALALPFVNSLFSPQGCRLALSCHCC